MNNITYTVGLGTFCMTSNMFKSLNKKMFSCPFDWILSDIDMVTDCIEDKFYKLMNKDNYEEIILEGNKFVHHKAYPQYINTKKGQKLYTRFIHHNPLLKEDHYNYFTRCVDRFKKVMDSEKKKLFLCIDNKIPLNVNIEKYINLDNCIGNNTTNYMLIVILIHPRSCYKSNIKFFRKNVGRIKINHKTDNMIIYDLYAMSFCKNGLNFSNDKDNQNIKDIIESFNYCLEDITI